MTYENPKDAFRAYVRSVIPAYKIDGAFVWGVMEGDEEQPRVFVRDPKSPNRLHPFTSMTSSIQHMLYSRGHRYELKEIWDKHGPSDNTYELFVGSVLSNPRINVGVVKLLARTPETYALEHIALPAQTMNFKKSKSDEPDLRKAPTIREFLYRIDDADLGPYPLRVYFGAWIASLFTSDPNRALSVVMYGRGKDGKSMFWGMVERLLGPRLVLRMESGDKSDKFRKAETENKALVYFPDSSNPSALLSEELKVMTGEDWMVADKKFEQPRRVRQYFRVAVVTNNKLIYNFAPSLTRRVMLVPILPLPPGTQDIPAGEYASRLWAEREEFVRWCYWCYDALGHCPITAPPIGDQQLQRYTHFPAATQLDEFLQPLRVQNDIPLDMPDNTITVEQLVTAVYYWLKDRSEKGGGMLPPAFFGEQCELAVRYRFKQYLDRYGERIVGCNTIQFGGYSEEQKDRGYWIDFAKILKPEGGFRV